MSPPCYAGIVSRLMAVLIDAAALTVVTPVAVLGPPMMWQSLAGTPPTWFTSSFQIAGATLPLVYFSLAWWATGQTLGGLVLAIMVRRADGSRVGLLRAALRAALGLLFAPIWFLGMILVLVQAHRRAMHDLVFGTVVVRKPAR
ncbi:RDD family protein [Nonomuraea sp. PA05]|nr:RDD family protein [Nonomuraea sp. PA05]